MGQVYVKASRRARAYTRRQRIAIGRFTPANKKKMSALRSLKSANKFLSGSMHSQKDGGLQRALHMGARVDRQIIREVIAMKRQVGGRKSVYK